jgi:putative SOS response-associated peptidase YedK
MASGEPMSLAGLWERWRQGDGAEVLSCTIITTAANSVMAPIHDRMPVILSRDGCEAWLRPTEATPPEPSPLQSCPPEWLRAYRVSTKVNSPRNNDSSLIDPAVDGDG